MRTGSYHAAGLGYTSRRPTPMRSYLRGRHQQVLIHEETRCPPDRPRDY